MTNMHCTQALAFFYFEAIEERAIHSASGVEIGMRWKSAVANTFWGEMIGNTGG